MGTKAENASHYERNKRYYYLRNLRVKEAKRTFIRQHKDKPCADCGVQYPHYVMEFHHRDPSIKKFSLGYGITKGWQALKEEVAKCDVLCSNCHRIREHG